MKTEIISNKRGTWLVLTPETKEESDALGVIESRSIGVRYKPIGQPLHICIDEEVHEEKT